MNTQKITLVTALLSVILTLITVLFYINTVPTEVVAGQGGISANECDIVATTTVIVGPGASRQVLAADARRAWAVVEQQRNASNTVSLAFGITATKPSGYALAPGQASTTPSQLNVGLNTDFPYVGAVNAITSVGSTTVRVIDCRY